MQQSLFTTEQTQQPGTLSPPSLKNMAESFVSEIAGMVLLKLGSVAYEEVCLAWSVKNDIEKLADTLATIKIVLVDAEKQQAHNPKLRHWSEKLKEVCYDAEDVLDEIDVVALRKKIVSSGSITGKVRHFFSCSNPLVFGFMIRHKIKEIRERLTEISIEKDNFNLTEKIDDNKTVMVEEREFRSFVHASEIVGRDMDKKEIIKHLMDPNGGENVSVISVVGIGGLGKTALAKLVYDDEMINQHFELKMWACVSEDFDLKQLVIKILESATTQNYSNLNVEHLVCILQGCLSDKKYLLILDDVWNDEREIWIKLKSLLIVGAYGSQILVTTRSNQVAFVMDSVSIYKLGGLSDEECLSLFLKCAFIKGQEKKPPKLVEIGKEIVKKCGGVPLAIRTLGSLLFSSIDEEEWKSVRDNDIWNLRQMENDVLNVLRLSYDHLPSHLKQCFAYCSIYPKDFDFESDFLIQEWMANGFLEPRNGNQDTEIIGMQYLKELMSRSFFQDIVRVNDFYVFKMHDLMHDLATSLMKSECFMVKSNSQYCPKSIRYLSFDYYQALKIDLPSFLFSLNHIKAIGFYWKDVGPSQPFLESIISRLHRVRLLDLGDANIEVLPKRIGDLRHLRYLDLSRNTNIKKLPNSICKLHRLEALLLRGCDGLKELPRDMRYLISLRMLRLTMRQKLLPNNGVGCLNTLRQLVIENCQNLEYLVEDIGGLRFLRRLWISKCPSLCSLPRALKYLSSLENLILGDCEKLDLNLHMEVGDTHQALDSTIPHLRLLYIFTLPQVVELPRWLLQVSANTLRTLFIRNCSNFKALPESMQNLESLEELLIRSCPKLSSLPEDMHRLSNLRELDIEECCALTERCQPRTGEDWPKIAHVPYIWLDSDKFKSSNY